jgi:hypothetical protein
MIRFIFWALSIGLAIGFGPQLVTVTVTMAKVAIHAHQFDQMSYAKFTDTLLNAKPKILPKNSDGSRSSH